MKKIFFAWSIAAMMVSCNNDETIDVVDKQPIIFGNAFVENSTRAIDNTYGGGTEDVNQLKMFNVYGTVTGNGNTTNIYKGDEVTGEIGNEEWVCAKTQYWVPDASYTFMALVDADVKVDENIQNSVECDAYGMPTKINYNVSSQKDLLYAIDTRNLKVDNNTSILKFNFEHLLAKVMFTFTNNFPQESDVNLKVTDLKITNVPLSGEYDFKEWTTNKEGELEFGNSIEIVPGGNKGTSDYARVLIPGEYQFNITFEVQHNKGGKPTEMKYTTDNINIEAGHSYNFTAELNQNNVEGVLPITFTITEDNDWSSGNDIEVNY